MADGPGGKEVGRISVRVVPNTTRFRSRLKEKLEEIERSEEVEIGVDLDASGAKSHMRALLAELKGMAGKGVDVKVGVDRKALSSIGNGATFAASGLGSMSHGLVIAAAVAAFAAPALALLSGVLVTMPALLTGVALPMAAVALGLDGIKKAAETSLPGFTKLKEIMSERFQDVLTPVFTKLNEMFPMLNQSMPGIATGLGDMARAFADTVTSQKGMSNIQSIIDNVGKALSNSAPGIAAFTDGLTTLIAKVAEKFPALSGIFNGWGDSFQGWVDKITKKDWFGQSPLDKGLKSFKDTMTEILNLVGDLAKKGFEFLSDPDFGKDMKSFVEDVKDLVNNVLPSLGKFFQDLSGFMKETRSLIDALPDWIKGGGDAPKVEQPKNPTASGIFPGWESGKTPWAEFQESWNATMLALKTDAQIIWALFKQRAAEAFSSITTIAVGAWNAVVESATGVVAGIATKLAAVPVALQTAWANLQAVAAEAWNSVVSTVAGVLGQVVAAVVTGGTNVVSEVASWPGKIVAALGDLGSLLINAGKSLMDGLLSGIRAGFEAVKTFVSGIAGWIADHKGPLPYDKRVLVPNGEALMQGLCDGMDSGFQDVIARTKAMARAIFEAMKEVFGSADGMTLNLNFAAAQQSMSALASTAADLRQAANSAITGALPVQQLSDETKQMKAQLDYKQQELELEKKRLAVQKAETSDKDQKAQIQAQIDALDLEKKRLAVNEQQLKLSQEYTTETQNQAGLLDGMAQKGLSAGLDFASANGQQFMSDLGIGGDGAIPAIADYAAQFGKQFIFNVSNVDEAIAVKNNQVRKDSLQYRR